MKGIISIKTQGVSGYLVNSSTVFPVQRMGVDMWQIHTVQDPNRAHNDEVCIGSIIPTDDIQMLIDGLDSSGQLSNCSAVIAGYQTGTRHCDAICEVVSRVKAKSRQSLYVCDPELNDPIADKDSLLEHLMLMADVIVPTQYVLEQFTGIPISSIESAVEACKKALDLGPKIILVKNLQVECDEVFTMMLATPKAIYLGQRPMLDFETQLIGVGDLITAVFTACLVKRMSPVTAFRHTANAVYGVLELTCDSGSSEIETIAGQYEFVEPTFDFPVKKLMAL
ncbi:pyridoxal kinase [Vibrio sp. YIC-376]|uniref:pyridoxal kinase n=1 Tax=Vibrio sp. YIC-376 TaxID=3136162 RepID=UPI00402AAFEA